MKHTKYKKKATKQKKHKKNIYIKFIILNFVLSENLFSIYDTPSSIFVISLYIHVSYDIYFIIFKHRHVYNEITLIFTKCFFKL